MPNALALATVDTFRNQVVCCDALTLLRSLPSGCVKLTVSSPPYDDMRIYNGFTWDFESIARELYRVTMDGGVVVWVVGDATIDKSETLTSFKQAIYFKESVGFLAWDTMIYHKTPMPGDFGKHYVPSFEYMFVFSKGEPATFNPIMRKNVTFGRMGSGGNAGVDGWVDGKEFAIKAESVEHNVWDITASRKRTILEFQQLGEDHPAKFPEALAERHILSWSNAGDVVLDPFGGSGTTAKMARANGRDYITCDISEDYCELMRRRLAMPYTLPMFAVA